MRPPTQAVIVTLAMIAASAAMMLALQAQPRDPTEVAAVFPPWRGDDGAFAGVARAGGEVVRQGIIGTILVVHGDDPGLVDRLYAAGAWLVIDPVAFGGCLAGNPGQG